MSTKKSDNVEEDKKVGRRSLRLRNLSSDSDTSTQTIGSPKRMVITRNQLSTIKEKGSNTQLIQQKSINSPYKTRRNANKIENVAVNLEQIINTPSASLRKKRASSELNNHDASKLNLDSNLKSYSVSPPRTMSLSVLKLQTKFDNNNQKSESVINISDTDEENDLYETDEVTIKPELPKYLTLNNEINSSNSNNVESDNNDKKISSENTDYKRLMAVSNSINNDKEINQSNEEYSVESDMSINKSKTYKNIIEDIQIENSLIQNNRLNTEPDSKSNHIEDNKINESAEEVISLHDNNEMESDTVIDSESDNKTNIIEDNKINESNEEVILLHEDNEMDSDTVIDISKNSSNISTIEDVQIENGLIQNERLNTVSDSKTNIIEDNEINESNEEVISLHDNNEMESDTVIDISKNSSNIFTIEDIQIENGLIQNERLNTESDNKTNIIEDNKINESNEEVILLHEDNEMDSDTVIDIIKNSSNISTIEDIQIENGLIQNKRLKTESDNKSNNMEDDKINESNEEVISLHYDNEISSNTVINKSENSSNIPTTEEIQIENGLIQNKRLNTDSDSINNNIEDNKMNQSNDEGILLREDNGMESDKSINKSENSCNISSINAIEDIHIEDILSDKKRLNTESDSKSNNIADSKVNQSNEEVISLDQDTSINENKNSSNISNAIEDSLIENKRLNKQSNNKNNNIKDNKINNSNEEVTSLVEENIIELDVSINKCKNSICDKIKDNLDVTDNKMSNNKSKNATNKDIDVKIVDNNLVNESSIIVNDSESNCKTIFTTVENKENVSIKKKPVNSKFQKLSVSIDDKALVKERANILKSSKSLKSEDLATKRNIQDAINTSITHALNSIEEKLIINSQKLYDKLLKSTAFDEEFLAHTPDNNRKRLNSSTPYPIPLSKRTCSGNFENKINDVDCKGEMVNTNSVKNNITQKADKDLQIDTSLEFESDVTSEKVKSSKIVSSNEKKSSYVKDIFSSQNANSNMAEASNSNIIDDKEIDNVAANDKHFNYDIDMEDANDANAANHDSSKDNNNNNNDDPTVDEDDTNNDNKTKTDVSSSNIKDRKSINLSLESSKKAQENDNNDKENEKKRTGDDAINWNRNYKTKLLSLSSSLVVNGPPVKNLIESRLLYLDKYNRSRKNKLESDAENCDDNIEKDVSENEKKKFEEKRVVSIDNVLATCNSYLDKVNEEKQLARLASRKEKLEKMDRIKHKKELKLLIRAKKLAAAEKLHAEKLEKMEKKKLKKERKLSEKNLMENDNLLSSNASTYSSVTQNENVTIVKLTNEERQAKASENDENDQDCKLVPQIRKALLNSMRLLINSRKMENEQKNELKELQKTKTKNTNQNKIKDPEIVEALKLYDIAKIYSIKKPKVKESNNKGDIKNTQISELPLSEVLLPQIVNSSGKFLVDFESENYKHQFKVSNEGSTGNFMVTVMPPEPTPRKTNNDDYEKYQNYKLRTMFNNKIKRITSQELILSKEKQRKFE